VRGLKCRPDHAAPAARTPRPSRRRPDNARLSPRPSRRYHDSARRSPRPSRSEAAVARTVAVPPRRPCRSLIAIVSHRRLRAGELPHFLGRLPCVGGAPPLGRRAAPPPCSVAAPAEAKWAVHAGCASTVSTGRAPRGRGPRPRCATGPSAVSGPVALRLDFIFSEYIQFLANSKICVGFI
jgi:hypothetical protein